MKNPFKPSSVVVNSVFIGLICLSTGFHIFGQKQELDVRALAPGKDIDRRFKAQEIHVYEIKIKRGQVIKIDLQAKDADVRLVVMRGPRNQVLAETNLGFVNERETLTFIAAQSGLYGIAVIPSSNTSPGGYQINAAVKDVADQTDRTRIKAEKLCAEAVLSASKQTDPEIQEAIKKLEEALPLWRTLKDDYWTQLTARRIKQFKFLLNPIDARVLPADKIIERRIAGGVTHVYSIKLEQGQVLRVDIQEIDFNLKVGLLGPEDKEISSKADFGYGYDRETLTFIAEKTDNYLLILTSRKGPENGSYQLKTEIKNAATEEDRVRIKAEALTAKGLEEHNKYNAEGTREAITKLQEAWPLWQRLGDKYWEATVLTFLGRRYDEADEKAKALEYSGIALRIWIDIGDKGGEASVLNNIGLVYCALGENQKGIGYYEQAEKLLREAGHKRREAQILINIGSAYSRMGETRKALEHLNQGASLSKSLNDNDRLAHALNSIGGTYQELGDFQKALDYYNQALPLWVSPYGKVKAHNNLGAIHSALGDKKKALEYYREALTLSLTLGSKRDEAGALNNLGLIHSDIGEEQEAIRYYKQALAIWQAVGDKEGEATTLNNIGGSYRDSGERQKALEYFYQALPLSRITNVRLMESITASNVMMVWRSLDNPGMAILFGKLSLNNLQGLRGAASGLENEAQKLLRRRVRPTYQQLAELLIKTGQVEQAIHVINLYHDEQFFDFSRPENAPVTKVPLSWREQEIASRFESSIARVGQLGLQVEELKRQSHVRQLPQAETARLQKLEAEFNTANSAFLAVLKDAETELVQPASEKDIVSNIKDVADMKSALSKLSSATGQKTAALYTLIKKDKLHLIVLTPDGEVKPYESTIKQDELNQHLIEFHALLQSPTYDPRPLGKVLYNIIFKPVAAILNESGVQTLMWQLDGNLRYVPMAALFDGEKYLAERYQNVVFTRTDVARMLQTVPPDWTGTGFGSSKNQTVDLPDTTSKIDFAAIPGVVQELRSIFRTSAQDSGILNGAVFTDEQFTKNTFYQAMKQRRPLVHISSHFMFRPGDDSRSFLLLGDGTALTLNEMKQQERIFAGVELLTLSACNTAAIQPDANGKEIDGFAELAQRLGAGSVLATLWQVADSSTPWLMREFYAKRQSKRRITKAEALRHAQLALLNGTAATKPLSEARKVRNFTRGEIVYLSKKNVPLFPHDRKKPFAHPYYWSPFVLFGNWL